MNIGPIGGSPKADLQRGDRRSERIEAERDGEQLVLRVIDDGPGCSAIEGDQLPPGKGVGLRNTRERLHVLYGDTGGFSVRNRERGIEVTLRLPFETSQTLVD